MCRQTRHRNDTLGECEWNYVVTKTWQEGFADSGRTVFLSVHNLVYLSHVRSVSFSCLMLVQSRLLGRCVITCYCFEKYQDDDIIYVLNEQIVRYHYLSLCSIGLNPIHTDQKLTFCRVGRSLSNYLQILLSNLPSINFNKLLPRAYKLVPYYAFECFGPAPMGLSKAQCQSRVCLGCIWQLVSLMDKMIVASSERRFQATFQNIVLNTFHNVT